MLLSLNRGLTSGKAMGHRGEDEAGLKLPLPFSKHLQAGTVIAQEAGAFISGAPDAPHDGVVDEKILTGRKYIIVRGVAGLDVRFLIFATHAD